MQYLKFYKPIITINLFIKLKFKIVLIKSKKLSKFKLLLNDLTKAYYVSTHRICFFTFKYKTQLNILKQSRFKLRHDLTFNKNHTWSKYLN